VNLFQPGFGPEVAHRWPAPGSAALAAV